MCERALDDLEAPIAEGGDAGHLWPLITGIGENAVDEREALACPAQKRADAVAVLNVGGKNVDVQQEAERIDENVPLAARDLLARILALRILRPLLRRLRFDYRAPPRSGSPLAPLARAPRHRAPGGCAPTCGPSPAARNRRAPCSWAADPSVAPPHWHPVHGT